VAHTSIGSHKQQLATKTKLQGDPNYSTLFGQKHSTTKWSPPSRLHTTNTSQMNKHQLKERQTEYKNIQKYAPRQRDVGRPRNGWRKQFIPNRQPEYRGNTSRYAERSK